ncbi:MAG: hypothetical protein AAFW73_15895 [Bacteroidota bacterium]
MKRNPLSVAADVFHTHFRPAPTIALGIAADSHFHFNPFGGLRDEELERVLVPHPRWSQLLDLVRAGQPLLIELCGAKGRGKTTHLKRLYQLFPQAALQCLHTGFDPSFLRAPLPPLLLIDSIHHLSLPQRLQLYRQSHTLILTTHRSRLWEYRWAGKASHHFRFRSSDPRRLQSLLENRLRLARKSAEVPIALPTAAIEQLIHHFGDDYRGTLQYLYHQYQSQL